MTTKQLTKTERFDESSALIKENKCNFKRILALRKFCVKMVPLIQFPVEKIRLQNSVGECLNSLPKRSNLHNIAAFFHDVPPTFARFSFRSQNASSSTFVTHEQNHSKCIPENDGRPQTNPVKKRYDRVWIRLSPGLCRKSNSGRIE